MKILVTGGAGFIGSNFIRHILDRYPDDKIVNLDKLTYAGNPENLRDVENDPRYTFVEGDICDSAVVKKALAGCDAVVNFAAETHVDRSISSPRDFIMTDVVGAQTILDSVNEQKIPRFVHISTDEVYGSVVAGSSTEKDPLNPSSPYSASKAAADLLCLAYRRTYGTPILITRSSNNFGPYQYPEKLVSLLSTNALDGGTLPVYADGSNVRDWVYVLDNCRAIDVVLRDGADGEVYNVGGGNEVANIRIARLICAAAGVSEDSIEFVADRPGHDFRYSLDSSKIRALGWAPETDFEPALADTVKWYLDNKAWWRPLKEAQSTEHRAKS